MTDYLEPVEEAYTTWANPLSVEQVVDIYHEDPRRPVRYRFAPGETRKLPRRFDRAIHRVHNGVVVGGLAPLLVKVGADEKLDPALDPHLAARKEAEAAQAAAALHKRAAEEALVVAANKLADGKAPGEAKPAAEPKADAADPKKAR